MAAEILGDTGLCEDAEKLIRSALDDEETALRALLERCGSPLEETLLIAMWRYWRCQVLPQSRMMAALVETTSGSRWVVVEPQKSLPAGAVHYRGDFLVALADGPASPSRENPLIVEVDGKQHDEPGAVSRDRRRDRAIVGLGLRVVRFSGSEVYHRAETCVEEIDALLRAV